MNAACLLDQLRCTRPVPGRLLRPAGPLLALGVLAVQLMGCASHRERDAADPSEDFAIAVLVLSGGEDVPAPWSSSVFAVYPDRTLRAGFIDEGTVPRLEAGTRRYPPYARTLSRESVARIWLLSREASGGEERDGGMRAASLDTHQPIPGVPSAVLEVTAFGTRSYHLYLGPLEERLQQSLETEMDADWRVEAGAFERLLVLLRDLAWRGTDPGLPFPAEP